MFNLLWVLGLAPEDRDEWLRGGWRGEEGRRRRGGGGGEEEGRRRGGGGEVEGKK